MYVSEIIKVKEFSAVTNKEAYLKACKWISTNIIAVDNSKNVTYKIEKVISKDCMGKIRVTIYVTEDEEEIHNNHCNICQELARGLYMKENKYRCEVCKLTPYRERIKRRMESIKLGVKEKLGI